MYLVRTTLCIALLAIPLSVLGQNDAPRLDEPSVLRPAGYKAKYPANKPAIDRGRQLFNDAQLSTNGRACASCHADAASFGAGFKQPYPHAAMNSKARFGVDTMNLDEVIQVCMKGPMRNVPLEWGSPELTDMTTYLLKVQSTRGM